MSALPGDMNLLRQRANAPATAAAPAPPARAGGPRGLCPTARHAPPGSTSAPAATTTGGWSPSRCTLATARDPALQGRRGPARRVRGDPQARSGASAWRSTSSPTTTPAAPSRICSAAKARKGVRVYVIYDSFGSFGSAGASRRCLRRCVAAACAAGVPSGPAVGRPFSWRPANRDHRKMLRGRRRHRRHGRTERRRRVRRVLDRPSAQRARATSGATTPSASSARRRGSVHAPSPTLGPTASTAAGSAGRNSSTSARRGRLGVLAACRR